MSQPVIEVAIGLVAAFFLISLMASAVVEVFSNIINKRSKDLEKVLKTMLSAGGTGTIDFKQTSVYKAMQAASGRSQWFGIGSASRKPSYISARSFADGVVEGLVQLEAAGENASQVVDRLPDGLLKQRLKSLENEVGNDLAALKAGLEGWFDDTMDRLSGAYKRWSQWILLIVGIALAIGLNVSAVRITDSLWNDAALRAAVATSVGDLTDAQCPTDPATGKPADSCPPEDKIENAVSSLKGLGLPIGWTSDWDDESGAIPTILGMLLTGAAVIMGAPFWFDLLTRLGGARGGRAVPPKAGDDAGSATVESRTSAGGGPTLSDL